MHFFLVIFFCNMYCKHIYLYFVKDSMMSKNYVYENASCVYQFALLTCNLSVTCRCNWNYWNGCLWKYCFWFRFLNLKLNARCVMACKMLFHNSYSYTLKINKTRLLHCCGASILKVGLTHSSITGVKVLSYPQFQATPR